MSTYQQPTPPPRPTTERAGEITTIWADGNITRTAPNGRLFARPSVPAIYREDDDEET
jgi:hypothetical protein